VSDLIGRETLDMTDSIIGKLVENALDFLLSAAQHARVGDIRSIKFSLLHLATSVELLLKARLSREHWALLFQDVSLASRESLVSGRFRSVDFDTAVGRLKRIADVKIDQPALRQLKELRDLRNSAVHFSLPISPDRLKALLAKGHNFVLDFCKVHLREEADMQSHQMALIRTNLREFDYFVKERFKRIKPALQGASLVLECTQCLQRAMILDNDKNRAHCSFCDYAVAIEDLAAQLSEGRVQPCPYCEAETCILTRVNNDEFHWYCLSCDNEGTLGELRSCTSCQRVLLHEVGHGLCSDCWQGKREREHEREP
jgi:hypothetical protein